MARIGIQLMMLEEHVAEQGILTVPSRVRETGFEVVEVSRIPMTEANVAAMESAPESLGIEFAAISAKTYTPSDDGGPSREHLLAPGDDSLITSGGSP